MSLWNLLDNGMSHPAAPNNWRQRFLYWLGRRLALRHKHVHIPKSCRIHPGAKVNPRNGEIRFGENCIVADGAFIQGNVTLGNDCSIQAYTIITGYGTLEDKSGQISIGNGVRMASHSMLIAANHNFESTEEPIFMQGLTYKPITLENDIWVGGRVNITCGVTIGHGCVIGGGSVVTKDIPPLSVAAGIPAKVIKSRVPRK